MSTEFEVDCPTCKKKVVWTNESKFRPFCSDRCQKIDLGAWADESYTIPVQQNEQWSEGDTLSGQSQNALNGQLLQ